MMVFVGRILLLIEFTDVDGIIDTSEVSMSDILVAIGVVLATVVVAALIGRATRRYLGRPDTSSLQLAGLAARAAKWVVIFVGTAWALSLVGADLGWFAITIVLVVVMAGLAARPMLEKFAAGVALTSRPAFTVDDEIGINGFEGEVIEITGRSTVLRLRDGRRVHIPNTQVVDETITVYTTDQRRRSSVELEVESGHPIEAIERVLLDALGNVDAVATTPPPHVRAERFGQDSIVLSVRLWHHSGLEAASEALDQALRAMSTALSRASMSLVSASMVVDVRKPSETEPPSAAA
jgi:small conductance mechanosensitive channel